MAASPEGCKEMRTGALTKVEGAPSGVPRQGDGCRLSEMLCNLQTLLLYVSPQGLFSKDWGLCCPCMCRRVPGDNADIPRICFQRMA